VGQIIGFVLSTNGAGGTYNVRLLEEAMAVPTPSTNTVATSQTRTSTTYGDLTTSGPAVTATITAAGKALVTVTMFTSTAVSGTVCFMTYAVSGATTVAASDTKSVSSASTGGTHITATYLVTGLTAGSNVFTAKYRSEVSGDTCTFADRNIIVTPY
jgi:hypothetical protein